LDVKGFPETRGLAGRMARWGELFHFGMRFAEGIANRFFS
jgi:hypothetical protein